MTPAIPEWLLPDSLWWDGRLQTGVALAPGREVVPVAAVPAGAARRRLPGTVLPGLCDAHVHSALVDLPTVAAGGISSVWDLGGVPAKVAALAARGRPAVRFAGPFLIAPGGYPSDRAWAPAGSCRAVRSAADADGGGRRGPGRGRDPDQGDRARRRPGAERRHAGRGGRGRPRGRACRWSCTRRDRARSRRPGRPAPTCWRTPRGPSPRRRAGARLRGPDDLDQHAGHPRLGQRDAGAGAWRSDNLRRFLGHGGKVRYGTDLGNGPLPPGINPRETARVAARRPVPGRHPGGRDRPGRGEPAWLPAGLDLEPRTFADSLATARVLGPEVRPR